MDIQLFPKKKKQKKRRKPRNIAWLRYNRSIAEICAEDNRNQNLWVMGKISADELRRRSAQTNAEYDEARRRGY